MVSYLARLLVADNTGVRVVQCINLLGFTKRSISRIGNCVVIVTKRLFS